MTVSAGDAHPYPIYGGRFRVLFPILDADGDFVTGATGLDSEASIDCATFADCTNEATELATASGLYYLDLTATELTSSSTMIQVKTSSSGAKSTPIVLYPKRLPIVRSGTAQAGAASTITLDSGASSIDSFYVGCWIQCSNNTPSNVQGQTRLITGYVGSTKVATVGAAWGTNPSSSTTFDILAEMTSNLVMLSGTAAPVTSAGILDVNTKNLGGTAQTGRDVGASVLLSSGTSTGQLDFTSGVVKANLAQILGTALTETTGGFIAAAFKKFFDKSSPTGTINSIPDAVAGATGGLFIAGTNAATTVTTALTTTFTGNLSGSVGSVTGNVGGNVVGSVASVAGAVGSVTGSVGSIATGGIAAASFAAGAIDASAIAANAIGASELASDAVAEIQSGLATSSALTTAQTSLDTISGYVDTEVAAILAAVDTEVAAIKAKTDNLPASPAAVGSAMTLTSGERDAIALAYLKYDQSTVTGEPNFSPINANRAVRLFEVSTDGLTLTVFKEDGVTVAFTADIASATSSKVITGLSTP